jgi:uncharacterized protein Smg (DUF494 family)
MDNVTSEPMWWTVVRAMAELVTYGYDELELTERYIREELREAGFALGDIEEACAWVERAVNSGTVVESLAMLQAQGGGIRISHPMERVCFSKRIWSKIELCRHKGILSNDVIERMLEGARVIDTRDWDDEEVSNLLAEIFISVLPGTSEVDFFDLFQACVPEFYC